MPTNPLSPETPIIASPSRGADTPSLNDVLAWQHTASVYIAMYFPHSQGQADALAAVSLLTKLARRALEAPTDKQLRGALMVDVYCHAAYAYGAKEERRRIDEERRDER